MARGRRTFKAVSELVSGDTVKLMPDDDPIVVDSVTVIGTTATVKDTGRMLHKGPADTQVEVVTVPTPVGTP